MLGAPSQPETSNSPVRLRGKERDRHTQREKEREGDVLGDGVHRRTMNVAAKVPVQVVSPRVYDNRTLEAGSRETRSTRYPRTSQPQLNS